MAVHSHVYGLKIISSVHYRDRKIHISHKMIHQIVKTKKCLMDIKSITTMYLTLNED